MTNEITTILGQVGDSYFLWAKHNLICLISHVLITHQGHVYKFHKLLLLFCIGHAPVHT